tara:strand:- start:15 stop:290 length:276 start_codon:yes stop_codon:yes gene_type:complete
MKLKLAFAFVAVAVASTASANSGMNGTFSPLDKIVQGHAAPGETATSVSNPEVKFRVLANGMVERTNEKFGTTSVIDPRTQWNKNRSSDNR